MTNKIENQHVLTAIDISEMSEEIDIEKILEKITYEYLRETVIKTKKGKIIIFHNPNNSKPGRYWDNWYQRPLFEEYLQRYPDSEIFLGWKFTDTFKHNFTDSRRSHAMIIVPVEQFVSWIDDVSVDKVQNKTMFYFNEDPFHSRYEIEFPKTKKIIDITEYYNPFNRFFKEELEDIENDKLRNIDTIIFECKICGMIRELNNKELEDAVKFISEYDLKVSRLVKYIEFIEHENCKNGDDHQFKFHDTFVSYVHEIISKKIKVDSKEFEIKKEMNSIDEKVKESGNIEEMTCAEIQKLIDEKEKINKNIEEKRRSMGDLVAEKEKSIKRKEELDIHLKRFDKEKKILNDEIYRVTRIKDIDRWIGIG